MGCAQGMPVLFLTVSSLTPERSLSLVACFSTAHLNLVYLVYLPLLPACLPFLQGQHLTLLSFLSSTALKMSSPQPKEVEFGGFEAVMFHFGECL